MYNGNVYQAVFPSRQARISNMDFQVSSKITSQFFSISTGGLSQSTENPDTAKGTHQQDILVFTYLNC